MVKQKKVNGVVSPSPSDAEEQEVVTEKHYMAAVGTLEAFDISFPHKWRTYVERFELYVLANDVQEESRQKAAFLTLAGAPLYELLTSLASPKQVSELKFADIKSILTSHFSHRSSEILAYFHFHKRDQRPEEPVINYIAALRALAADCKFGSSLDRMMRDRFVCGMKDKDLQRCFLSESDLTLQSAIDRALSSEAATQSGIFEDHDCGKEKPTDKDFQDQPQQCSGCGGRHARRICPFRDVVCRSCSLKGHLTTVCRRWSNLLKKSRPLRPCAGFGRRKVHQVTRISSAYSLRSHKRI